MNEPTFKFTRHVLSCNNIDEGKLPGLKDDYEPGLSHSGILETLKYVKKHKNDFKSCNICVSNLYRTWCTAVILYGNGLESNTPSEQLSYLNLWICPYLKEKHKTELNLRENGPKEMRHMIEKFKKFLNTLMIITKNKPEFKFPDQIKLLISTNESSYVIYTKYDPINPYTKNQKENTYFTYEFNYDNFDDTKDNKYYNNNPTLWLTNGNLQNFMDWWNDIFEIKDNIVHVVCHSNTMQNYVKELSLFKLKKVYDHKGYFCFTKKKYKPYHTKVDEKQDFVGKTNCWSFKTQKDSLNKIQTFFSNNKDMYKKISTIFETNKTINNMIIKLDKMYDKTGTIKILSSILSSIKMGVVKHINAKEIEQKVKKNGLSLCGYEGKVSTYTPSFPKRGGGLKKNITKKISHKKTLKKRGGCHRDYSDEDKAEKIKVIIPPFEKFIEEFRELGLSDDEIESIKNNVWKSYDTIEKETTHFIEKYPDYTYTEYLAFSYNRNNLFYDEVNKEIFILDACGNPIVKSGREFLSTNPNVRLWNLLHKKNKLKDFTNVDEDDIIEKYEPIMEKLLDNRYDVETSIKKYISENKDKTYEDWIKQHDIFKKYRIGDERIFSIMYLEQHPALYYWNLYSENIVTHRTKPSDNALEPNDQNIYEYIIPNKN